MPSETIVACKLNIFYGVCLKLAPSFDNCYQLFFSGWSCKSHFFLSEHRGFFIYNYFGGITCNMFENMFRVNNKDTRTTPLASFWCLYCLLWTYFTPCSNVSIVNFEYVITSWVGTSCMWYKPFFNLYKFPFENLLIFVKKLPIICSVLVKFYTLWQKLNSCPNFMEHARAFQFLNFHCYLPSNCVIGVDQKFSEHEL